MSPNCGNLAVPYDLSSPDGTIWQVTEPTSEALKRLKALKIHKPPLVLDHA